MLSVIYVNGERRESYPYALLTPKQAIEEYMRVYELRIGWLDMRPSGLDLLKVGAVDKGGAMLQLAVRVDPGDVELTVNITDWHGGRPWSWSITAPDGAIVAHHGLAYMKYETARKAANKALRVLGYEQVTA